MTDSAKKRAAENKKIRQESLREELKAREYLRQLEDISAVLGNWMTLTTDQVSALRLKADINFKRLNKVLPDLRATEIKHEHTGQVKFIVEE